MIDRIKDFIEEIRNEIEWVLAGCPKPVKIPAESKERKNDKVRDKN